MEAGHIAEVKDKHSSSIKALFATFSVSLWQGYQILHSGLAKT